MFSVHLDKVYGAGINDADYVTKDCPFYRVWIHMLERAYCNKLHAKYPTYKNVIVCDEWLTFSNFRKWMKSQDWRGNVIDKDLLKYGNKQYCPEFCLFVPKSINSMLTHNKMKNNSYPTGVYPIKNSNKYKSFLRIDGNMKYLGVFDTVKDAAFAYMDEKTKHFRRLAKKQNEKLSIALNNYADEFHWEFLNAG